jgi:hypothetical protein
MKINLEHIFRHPNYKVSGRAKGMSIGDIPLRGLLNEPVLALQVLSCAWLVHQGVQMEGKKISKAA